MVASEDRRRKRREIVLAVCSNGGHLAQMVSLLQSLDLKRPRCVWVTIPKKDAQSLLRGRFCLRAFYPSNRNLRVFARNFLAALLVCYRLRPAVIISTGAGIAVPYFIVAKLYRIPTVFIESFARVTTPSLTGKICYRLADHFIYQWPQLGKFYPKGIFGGSIY